MLGAQTSSSLQIIKLRPKNCDPCSRSQNRNKSRPFFTVQWVFTHFADSSSKEVNTGEEHREENPLSLSIQSAYSWFLPPPKVLMEALLIIWIMLFLWETAGGWKSILSLIQKLWVIAADLMATLPALSSVWFSWHLATLLALLRCW